jgi:hypothetical protein
MLGTCRRRVVHIRRDRREKGTTLHFRTLRAAVGVALVIALLATSGIVSAHPAERSYTITFENLTDGQPFSPIVAATHRNATGLFHVGSAASPGIEAVAEDGNNSVAFDALSNDKHAYDVVNAGVPVMIDGSVSFDITARPGDRLSLATMLICTNDGFTGLDGVKLPKVGSATFYLNAYDAGSEDNTEASADIVDPCSGIGPFALAGDPNGNENDAVDTSPRGVITHHPGIAGGADLDADAHGWDGPVAKVTVTLN